MSAAPDPLEPLLRDVASGRLSVESALSKLESRNTPGPPAGRVDHELFLDLERNARCGFPEAVYAPGKSVEQIVTAARALHEAEGRSLVSRVDESGATEIESALADLAPTWDPRSRTMSTGSPLESHPDSDVLIVAAGTTDIPVAEEARAVAEFGGSTVESLFDVGVAGLDRILGRVERLRRARVVVVVAGMDGALPSVVAGLVSAPVIACPTSIGYGAAFEGLSALLNMLTACAPGVAVVNIDNGFGAGVLAAKIDRMGHAP